MRNNGVLQGSSGEKGLERAVELTALMRHPWKLVVALQIG
jgi:hypothetical protein